MNHRCRYDERMSTPDDMDISFLVLLDDSDLQPDSELVIIFLSIFNVFYS